MIDDLQGFLDEKVDKYNSPSFIDSDPISIPHQFTRKEDIEISAFLVSTIAWGNRKMIIRSGKKLMELMGNSPFEFVMDHNEEQLLRLSGFVHRTFNEADLRYFVTSLRHLYKNEEGLEGAFTILPFEESLRNPIHRFKMSFFQLDHEQRTQKHLGDPLRGSAAKRLVMLLRWLVRRDNKGVDFGIWNNISMSKLSCPLDVHSGNVARSLGLLLRKQNDWKAVAELDSRLRQLDSNDPSKYDFALFGLGVFEGF